MATAGSCRRIARWCSEPAEMSGDPVSKPMFTPTAVTAPFWKAAAAGSLVVQNCQACGHSQFPPRAVCLRCRGDQLGWREASPFGTIFSFSIAHRAPTPAFKHELPYVVALVELDDGPLMMMNIRDAALDKV